MFKFNIVLIFFTLMLYKNVLLKKIECPSHCKCDIFEKYRRAMCINQRLVGVEADIPAQVELLDLSCNLIRELHDHIFIDLHLTSLKLLNLSHNKVGQIHMNAFSGMNNLKTIDLSYNNIGYLLENWFWDIPNLTELYLQGNNLQKLREGPIIESKSLKVLDLSSCSLPYIHADAFSKMSNLEMLDLSRNNLIQLNFNVITPLPHLKLLKLENNTWHCNNVMTKLTRYCKNKQITCTVCTEASPPTQKEKFQRMVVAPETTTQNLKNFWIYDEKKERNKTVIIEVCSNNSNANVIKKDLLLEVIKLSPVLALVIPFAFGLSVGLIVACGVAMRTPKPKLKKSRSTSYRTSIIRNHRSDDLYDYPLMHPESFEVCESTPVPQRKNNTNNLQMNNFL